METSRQRLIKIFLAELDERAHALDRDLLALEKEAEEPARLELFKALFRTAHSLKGAAGAASVDVIEIVCHGLEEAFAAARDGRLTLAPEAFRLFFACVDAIQDGGQRLRRGEDLADSPLALLLPQLDEAAGLQMAPTALVASIGPRAETPSEPRRIHKEDAVVRVAAQKLDLLLARSGEMVSIANRAETRLEELAGLRALLKKEQVEGGTTARALSRLASVEGTASAAAVWAKGRELGTFHRRRLSAAGMPHSGSLPRLTKAFDRLNGELLEDRRAISQAAMALDAEVRHVRMLPFAAACEGFARIVRDLCEASGKQAELIVVGGDIELDRSIIEGLKDPLLHLLRNAVDHGIEPAALRRAASKPSAGRIMVGAALRGTRVEVTVADDGPGLDFAAIRAHAREKRLPTVEGQELARYIFLPGFSTLETVTQVSGRGVGLDAVKTGTEAMRGSVDLTFEPGLGTQFVLVLPLTLTTIRALLVTVHGLTFALDVANVVRLLRADAAQLASVDGRTMVLLEDGPVPVIPLGDLLGLERTRPEGAVGALPLVLLQANHRQIAVVVDDFVGEQEILVRSLGRRLARARHIAGGTILPTGRIAFILNGLALIRGARGLVPTPMRASLAADKPTAAKRRVLLADDSVTTRTLERSILEVAGYEVIAAADGDEAWRLLQENGADIVVSDVEMPHMDGFAFTEAIRGSKRFKELPVILVTARNSERDKMRGLQVGANSYLVKSAFDQRTLLDAITQFL